MTIEAAPLPPPVSDHSIHLSDHGAPSSPVPTTLFQVGPDRPDSGQARLDLPPRGGLDEVQERLRLDDLGKWDLAVARDRLALAQGRLVLPEEHLDERPECLTLSPWALSQACERLGIPARYFLKCPPPLQDAQFNHWAWREGGDLENKDVRHEHAEEGRASGGTSAGRVSPWLLRCKGERVRAILSDRYRPLDNSELLGILRPLLEGRFEARGLSLTPESLHLRLVDPRLSREVLPNDRLMVGVHVANSETGNRSVTVDALVWRLICLNGLVRLVRGKSLLRQRHVSWDRPRFADALGRAVSEAVTAGAGLIDRLSLATREPVADVEGTIRAIGLQALLSQCVQERVKQALLATPACQQQTVYGLVQALTFTAQGLAPDARYDLEVLAGRLLDEGLPPPAKAESLLNRRPSSRRAQGG